MSDVWDGKLWIVRGPWEGGKLGGSVFNVETAVIVDFALTPTRIIKSFPLSKYGGSRDAARLAADAFRLEISTKYGLTKNMYRYVWAADTGEDWLEVQLTQNKIMRCDTARLPLVKKYFWSAQKHGRTFYARAKKPLADGKNKVIHFHRKIVPFKTIDHVNRSGLDNRLDNLRESTATQHNNKNHRKSRNNSSGVCGVVMRKKCPAWMATWREDGKPVRVPFAVSKYDDEAMAFAYACWERQGAERRLGITVGTDAMDIDA